MPISKSITITSQNNGMTTNGFTLLAAPGVVATDELKSVCIGSNPQAPSDESSSLDRVSCEEVVPQELPLQGTMSCDPALLMLIEPASGGALYTASLTVSPANFNELLGALRQKNLQLTITAGQTSFSYKQKTRPLEDCLARAETTDDASGRVPEVSGTISVVSSTNSLS